MRPRQIASEYDHEAAGEIRWLQGFNEAEANSLGIHHQEHGMARRRGRLQ